MNAEDAARINALRMTSGLAVVVVFAGISGNDTTVVQRAQRDLGLHVSVRQLSPHELEQYKSIGGAQLPMALIVKGRQLKTVVSGESMPRTLSVVEASLASIAVPRDVRIAAPPAVATAILASIPTATNIHHQSPEE